MITKFKKIIAILTLILIGVSFSVCTTPNSSQKLSPMVIDEQGSFAIGGSVITQEGQTLHGDHAYVFYQIPENNRALPLVFWHGFGQFSKTWESTPDGREGFQNLFLRDKYSVYVLDQPRRGNAGKSLVPIALTPLADEQKWFNIFRLGIWPNYFEGVQFPRDTASLEQYFRQMTPDTGSIDSDINANAVSALFNKIGDGILVTHSHSGGMGWQAVIKNEKIRGVVAYEPGSNFVFPPSEVPSEKSSSGGTLKGLEIPLSDFLKLTKIPIIIYYGDNIPQTPSTHPGQDQWRIRLEMARLWADVVNRHGGDATVVHLPQIGIYGNTHFPFSDLNNKEIAKLMSDFLDRKNLSYSTLHVKGF